jgi:phage terminase large subunit
MKGLRSLGRAAKAAGVPLDVIAAFVSAGYVPQPKQLVFHGLACSLDEWQPDKARPTAIGFGGARGGGKTHALIPQACVDCARYPNLRGLILRRTGAALVETLETFGPLLERFGARSTAGGFRFANGSRLSVAHFRNPADVDRHLGQSRDFIGIEEATTLTAAKFRALRTTVRGTRKDYRPRVYATTNPGGVGHAWYRDAFVLGKTAPNDRGVYRHIQATVDDNVIARQADPAYVAILDSLAGWELRAYRYGDWDIAAGAFFADRPVIEAAPKMRAPLVVFALDYGWTHPAAMYKMQWDWDTGRLYVTDELHAQRQPVEALAGWLTSRGASEVVAGSDVQSDREGLSVAERMGQHGVWVRPANQDRLAGCATIAEWLKAGKIVIDPACTAILEQLERIEANPARPGDVLKVNADPQTGEGGDDAFDAFRYGVMAVAQLIGEHAALHGRPKGGMVSTGPTTIMGAM